VRGSLRWYDGTLAFVISERLLSKKSTWIVIGLNDLGRGRGSSALASPHKFALDIDTANPGWTDQSVIDRRLFYLSAFDDIGIVSSNADKEMRLYVYSHTG
jgi:hypothetical protein